MSKNWARMDGEGLAKSSSYSKREAIRTLWPKMVSTCFIWPFETDTLNAFLFCWIETLTLKSKFHRKLLIFDFFKFISHFLVSIIIYLLFYHQIGKAILFFTKLCWSDQKLKVLSKFCSNMAPTRLGRTQKMKQ